MSELGKFHDEEWWADRERRGTAPIRCVGVWSYGRCRAVALYGASCGRSHPTRLIAGRLALDADGRAYIAGIGEADL